MLMGHKHLTLDKREILERLMGQGESLRNIARILGYSPSAISQEIKRTSGSREIKCGYDHKLAHQRACWRRKRASQKGKRFCGAVIDYVRQGLVSYWSPEQIAGRMRLDYPDSQEMRISFKTIYRWLNAGSRSKKPHSWKKYYGFLRLKRRGKRFARGQRERRGHRDGLPSIEDRPKQVEERSRFGDWECDLLRGFKSQGHLVTLVERGTGLLLAGPCADKHVETVNQAIISLLDGLGQELRRTITVDRGKEFYGYETLERTLGIRVYFCHPNCPNERGQNEQLNGLLRQFFPKRQSLAGISNHEVQRAVALINNRPKKKLGFRTTMELIADRKLSEVLSFA